MQLVFSWAPKLARKCESKHWLSCDADGRSGVITKFSWMGRLPHFLSHGATPTHALRARVKLLENNDIFNDCSLFTLLLVSGMIIVFISGSNLGVTAQPQ